MDGHFRAFSFVDRITAIQPGASVRGVYQIPSSVDCFPVALVAEAVGQLAAWSAMASLDFKVRPVAGIAAGIDLISQVQPGQILELGADIDSVDADAVSYCGFARGDGQPIVTLNHCVGPMLPQEDFDDTEAVKTRFATLCNGGVAPGAFGGIPQIKFENVSLEPGQWIRATLPVPAEAPFFADHFARRPVFPGTLFMNKVADLVTELASTIPAPVGSRWVPTGISDSKLRSFTPPGDVLEIEAKILKTESDSLLISAESRKGKRLSGGVRFTVSPRKIS